MKKIFIFITTTFLLIGCSQNNLWDNINDNFDEKIIPPPPGIVTMTPENGANHVYTDTVIEIIFDETIDIANLIQGNFKLLDKDGTIVGYSFNLTDKTVTMEPCSPLERDGSYSIHIFSVLKNDHIFTFTTVPNPKINGYPIINQKIEDSTFTFECNFTQSMFSDDWIIIVKEYEDGLASPHKSATLTSSMYPSAWIDRPVNKKFHIEISIDYSKTKKISIMLKNFQGDQPLGGFLNGISILETDPIQATYDYSIP